MGSGIDLGSIFVRASLSRVPIGRRLGAMACGLRRPYQLSKRAGFVLLGRFPEQTIMTAWSTDELLRVLGHAIVVPIALGVVLPLSNRIGAAGGDGGKFVFA